MTYRIDLDERSAVDGNVVTVTSSDGKMMSRYKLPTGKPRVTVHRLTKGQAQLAIGGYTTTTVAVTGPAAAIEQLREAVL